MNRVNRCTREFLKLSVASAVVAAVSPAALAQRKTPTAGAEYKLITPPQSVDTAGKIEVLEFFWYACPHCAAIEPLLKDWVKQLPNDIVFRKAHVPFNEIKHQQLFYTLEAMGKADEYGDKIFGAIHSDRNRLDSFDKISELLSKAGIDAKVFKDTWESFSVQTRMRKATSSAATYKVESVPSVVVNGTYLTSPSSAGGNQALLQVLDHLIAQERIKARK